MFLQVKSFVIFKFKTNQHNHDVCLFAYTLQYNECIPAASSENVSSDMCAQRRFRSDCAFTQSDQNLHWALLDSQGCKVDHADNEDSDQTEIRCAGRFESSLGAHFRKVRFLTFQLIYTIEWDNRVCRRLFYSAVLGDISVVVVVFCFFF